MAEQKKLTPEEQAELEAKAKAEAEAKAKAAEPKKYRLLTDVLWHGEYKVKGSIIKTNKPWDKKFMELVKEG